MAMVIEEDDNGTKQGVIDEIKKVKPTIEELQQKLDDVWQKILETAKTLCMERAYDTGTLYDTIHIETGYGDSGSTTAVSYSSLDIGQGSEAVTVYDSTIVAGDEGAINPKTGQPCIYAQWVHDGHFTPSGRYVDGTFFLEDAIILHESELDDAINEIMDKVEEGD
jgi:hypothetical protein